MTLSQVQKQDLISTYQKHETDTGSTDVQIAILTSRIDKLSSHLQKNPKDYNSRRGLLVMIGKRKRLLNYLAQESPDRFLELTRELKIRVRR